RHVVLGHDPIGWERRWLPRWRLEFGRLAVILAQDLHGRRHRDRREGGWALDGLTGHLRQLLQRERLVRPCGDRLGELRTPARDSRWIDDPHPRQAAEGERAG